MKISVIGGGPAGLYPAIQMKLRDRTHDIRVLERNPRGSTFGWGVVFSGGAPGLGVEVEFEVEATALGSFCRRSAAKRSW